MTPSPAPPRLGRKPGHSAATMAAAVEASRREKLLAVATRFGVPLSTLRHWRARAGLRRVKRVRDDFRDDVANRPPVAGGFRAA